MSHREPWSESDLSCLNENAGKIPMGHIATMLGRSKAACWKRASELGLLTPRAREVPRPLIDSVIAEECRRVHGVTPAMVYAEDHRAAVSFVRVAVYRRLLAQNYTQSAIGRAMGRDHSTIISALNSGRRKCRGIYDPSAQIRRNRLIALSARWQASRESAE